MSDWITHMSISGKDVTCSSQPSALIIRAGNVNDPTLFVRGSQMAIQGFLRCGYVVYILDVDVKRDYLEFQDESLPARNLGQIVSEAFLAIPVLSRIQIYAHARYDINLTDPGAELSAIPIGSRNSEPYNAHRVYIGDLKIGHPSKSMGLVDLFTCMTHANVEWPQLLADTLGWPVRTVAPGYSIYFPAAFPRAQLPSTRLFSLGLYDPRGWALWLPGWRSPIPAGEPAASEFRPVGELESRLTLRQSFSRAMEPAREWRRKLTRRHMLQ